VDTITRSPRTATARVVRQSRHRLATQPQPEKTQVDDQDGSSNQGQSHQMNGRDDRKEPWRLPHRMERRRILQPPQNSRTDM
jgi:hypothetical protein